MLKSPKQVKPTFRSFISTQENGLKNGDQSRRVSTADGYELDSKEEKLRNSEIFLLPGEIIVSEAEDVLQLIPYSPVKEETAGTLFTTNYRVIFVPKNRSTAYSRYNCARKNKLVRAEDITLSSIFAVYQVTKGKRKRLLANTYVSGYVKRLQLLCKDFRLHQFCFSNCNRDQVKVLVNAILHHFFPVNVELLFAFTYHNASPTQVDQLQQPVPEFLSPKDWQAELKRVKAKGFSVSSWNKSFLRSDRLPEYFVLPTSLSDSEIQRQNITCLPIWSYTHRNGYALMRMACRQTENDEEHAKCCYRSLSHLERLYPKRLETFDLVAKNLPSLKKLQTNFEQLREMCMPATYKDLINNDSSWFSMLDASQWLFAVSSTLNVAKEVAEAMSNKNNVIIKEKDGTDYNAVISSLAQLLLDPESRTIHGFQTLIEKEWVALGHKFSERSEIVSTKDAEQSPIFLVFLDCTWQLLQQFPSSFEFTEIFLTSIWDSVGLGMFQNFIFNSPAERWLVLDSIQKNTSKDKATFPMNAWDWNKQFSEEDITFFTNPLYSAVEQIRNLQPTKTSQSERYPDRYVKERVLLPCCLVANLKFWENCYLRWLAPLQIIGGGKPSEYIAQSLIMEDITSLQMAITDMEEWSTSQKSKHERQNSLLTFISGDSTSLLRRALSKHVSSSYPFSPTQAINQAVLFSVQDRISSNDDTLSMDEWSIVDCEI